MPFPNTQARVVKEGGEMKKFYGMLCVVICRQKVLLLKRSPTKEFFPNKWAMVGAAPLASTDDMRAIAMREIKDELGVEGKILKEGREIISKIIERGEAIEWHIFPFLAEIDTENIVLNSEHTQSVWVKPKEVGQYDIPEELKLIFKRMLGKLL